MLKHLSGFERHLRILQALSPATVNAYVSKIKEFHRWLEKNDKSVNIKFIKRQDVEGYLEYCFYQGNVNITRFTKLTALTKFSRYLVYEQIISKDFTADIPRPRMTKKFVQKFTKDEVLRFFQQINIQREKGLRDLVILICGAFCGLRMSEIINLTLNDIVFDEKSFDFNIIDTKFNSSRTVYLWKSPALFVRQWYMIRLDKGAKGNDPLLVSYKHAKATGRKLTAAAIDYLVKRIAGKAGIRKPEIHMHMFRATHINDLRCIKGYDLPAIAERVGHRDISTTDRYIPRRERIHKVYNSLHEYWSEFPHLWDKKEEVGLVEADSE